MRRRCAKMALSCAETNGFVGSDGSLSYSISKSQQRCEEHRGINGPMSAAASWRREKEAITYQSSVVSCVSCGQSCFDSHVHISYVHTIIQCCPYDQQSPSPVVNLIPHCHGCKVHHPTASHSQASPQCPSSALAFTRIQVASPRVLRHLNAAIGPSPSHFHNELLLFDLPFKPAGI